MKKTLTKLTAIIFMGALLLSLTGCGGLLNGDKKLTADHLTAEASLGSSTSSSKPVLSKVYYLKNGSNTKLWVTFNANTSANYRVIRLIQSNSDANTYYVATTGGDNNGYFQMAWENKGYEWFNENNLSDAYAIGSVASNSNSKYLSLSNIVKEDDFIILDANNRSVWPDDIEYLWSSTSGNLSNSENYSPGSSYNGNYLWVHLDNKVWTCFGSVSH